MMEPGRAVSTLEAESQMPTTNYRRSTTLPLGPAFLDEQCSGSAFVSRPPGPHAAVAPAAVAGVRTSAGNR